MGLRLQYLQESFAQASAAMAMSYKAYADQLAERGLRRKNEKAPGEQDHFPYFLHLNKEHEGIGQNTNSISWNQ